MAASHPLGSNTLATRLTLQLQCHNVVKLDTFSESDPFVVLYTVDPTGRRVEIGRTETIQNAKNPQFAKRFSVDYFFEAAQPMVFAVYDEDHAGAPLDMQDFVGEVEVRLGQIVGMHRGRFTADLHHPTRKNHRGSITVIAEEESGSSDEVLFQLRAMNCHRPAGRGLFGFLGSIFGGEMQCFLRISQEVNGTWTVVHRTETAAAGHNPVFAPFKMLVKALCNGQLERRLAIEIFEYYSNGDHHLVGGCETTLLQLTSGRQTQLDLNTGVAGGHVTGVLQIDQCLLRQRPSFLDYIRGGVELAFSVAIDFTASNGDPRRPESLHYFSPNGTNPYVDAITSVGSIIQDYDTDKQFPAFGFGARFLNGNVSHAFALNGNDGKPECAYIDGILQAYRSIIRNVELYGPTNFAPIINRVAEIASASRHCYQVLLIITDGAITDINDTIGAIVSASRLPMSIIIVGVGNGDFDSMNVLDADEKPLESRGQRMARDIVQFVPMRDFSNDGPVGRAALAAAVLEELPEQVVQYMFDNGIMPEAPPSYAPPM